MSDTENKSGKKIGLLGGAPSRPGQVRQSFSHGRSKAVVVETKRKRVVVPKPNVFTSKTNNPQKKSTPSKTPGGISEVELERRKKALVAARKREELDKIKRDADEKSREQERAEKRADLESKEKEETERKEKEKEKVEEEQRAIAAVVEAKKVVEELPTITTKAPEDSTRPAAKTSRKTPDRDELRKQQSPRTPKGGDTDRRRSGKLTLTQALSDGGGRQRSMAAIRRKQEREKRKLLDSNQEREKVVRDVQVPETIVVQELANRMAERVSDVVKSLMTNGMMVTQNQSIDADTAELIVQEFGHKIVRVSDADVEDVIVAIKDDPASLESRAPVITVMGHVDHGKTSLLDVIRKANVVSGEAGGITQHIGAYQVTTDDGKLFTFLDTPGHAAFTSMRSRGAQVTDIVILVVAADDSVMPQTIEAINHSKAANVPMIVAINKCDKPAGDPDKVRTELLQHEVIVEKMSGDVLDVEVSAETGAGIDTLLEYISLQSDLLELKANPNRAAEGAVIEAKLDVGRGPIATVLIQKGTLNQGDIFVVGEQWGRVRALINDQNDRVKQAGPSVPVEVLGLNGTPEAGDVLNVVSTEAQAREIADYRAQVSKDKKSALGSGTSLEQLLANAKADQNLKELPILVKSDVQGSAEAIVQAMEKIGNEEVKVRVLHSGVGAITESDVTLAEASKAPIMGFNVRANAPARQSANQKGVELRYYSVIYDLVDDIKSAASGLLSAEVRETFIGYAKILEVFKVTGVGKVAGCQITEGLARRSSGVRLLRDDVVIHEGTLKTLKRFKDEVNEVNLGQECGMAFENYEDIRADDVIEVFERQEIERNLA
ncbi:MAG: translation initiation factor IF-2 [Rhodobacterales bacterium]|tara:strand:+ start:435 stop:2933 length:2499 start_codon:yes stop_codon:yes gene_type:complete